jgi:hypothetical protein
MTNENTTPEQEAIISTLQEIMDDFNEGHADDLFKDVVVSAHNKPGYTPVVLVQYDGAGYDFFSYQADYRPLARIKLRERMEKEYGDRFYLEDQNTWSFNAWVEA